MPGKSQAKKKASANKDVNYVLDSFERWLSKQPVKRVRAKTGFISVEEKEEGEA